MTKSINPLLSIVIVSYNTADITLNCLKSVFQDKGLDFGLSKTSRSEVLSPTEVIIVDNHSTDDSLIKIKEYFKKIKLSPGHYTIIANQDNRGFSGGNNQGIKVAKGNYILLLNSDTIILHSAISQSLDWLSSHPEAGACTAQLLNSDKTIQIAGGFYPNLANIFTWSSGLDDLPLINRLISPFHPHSPEFYTHDAFYLSDRQLDWLSGAYILFRSQLLHQVGGFDEKYFMYGEEYELQYRIHQAFPQYQFWYLVGPQVIHLGGASSTDKNYPLVKEYHGVVAFFAKHKSPRQLKLVKIFLKLSPTLYLRALFYLLTFRPQRAQFYWQTCSKI